MKVLSKKKKETIFVNFKVVQNFKTTNIPTTLFSSFSNKYFYLYVMKSHLKAFSDCKLKTTVLHLLFKTLILKFITSKQPKIL